MLLSLNCGFLVYHADFTCKFISDWNFNFYESDDWYEYENYWVWLVINYKYNKYQKLYSFRYGCLVDDYYSDEEIDYTIINKFNSILYLLNLRDEDLRELERFERLQKYLNNLLVYDRFCDFIDFYFFQMGFFKRDLYITIRFEIDTHIYMRLYFYMIPINRKKRNRHIIFKRKRITNKERRACEIAKKICMVQAGIIKRVDYDSRFRLSRKFARVNPEFLYTCFSYSTGVINNKYYQEIIEWLGIKFRRSFLRFIQLPTTEPVYFSHYEPVVDLHKYRRSVNELDEFRWQTETLNWWYREGKPLRGYRKRHRLFYMYPKLAFKFFFVISCFWDYSYFFKRFFYTFYYKRKVKNIMYEGLYHSWIFGRLSFTYKNIMNRFWFYYNFIKFKYFKYFGRWRIKSFISLYNDFIPIIDFIASTDVFFFLFRFTNILNFFVFDHKRYYYFFFKKNIDKKKIFLKRQTTIFHYFYCKGFLLTSFRFIFFFFISTIFSYSNNKFSNLRLLNSYVGIYFYVYFFIYFSFLIFFSCLNFFFFFSKRVHYIKHWFYRRRNKLKNLFFFVLKNSDFFFIFYQFSFFFFRSYFILNLLFEKFFTFIFFNIFQINIVNKFFLFNIFYINVFFYINFYYFFINYSLFFLISTSEHDLMPVYENDELSVNYLYEFGLSNWIWKILDVFNFYFYVFRYFWTHIAYYLKISLKFFVKFKWYYFRSYILSKSLYLAFFYTQNIKSILDPDLYFFFCKYTKWQKNVFIKSKFHYIFSLYFVKFIANCFFPVLNFYNFVFLPFLKMSLHHFGDVKQTFLDFNVVISYVLIQLVSFLKISYLKYFFFKSYINNLNSISNFFFSYFTLFFNKIKFKHYSWSNYYLNAGSSFYIFDCTLRQTWYLDLEYIFWTVLIVFFPLKIIFFKTQLNLSFSYFYFNRCKSFFFNFLPIKNYFNLFKLFFVRNSTLYAQRLAVNLIIFGFNLYIYKRYFTRHCREMLIYEYETKSLWSLARRKSRFVLDMLFEACVWPRFLWSFISKVYRYTDVLYYYISLRFKVDYRRKSERFLIFDFYFSILKIIIRHNYIRYFVNKYSDFAILRDWVTAVSNLYAREYRKVYSRRKSKTYFFSSSSFVKRKFRRARKSARAKR